MKHKIVVGFLLVIVVAIGATWVWAQSDTVEYFACVNNASGTIQMAGPDDTCSNNAVLVSWNQVGPAGPKGDKGDPGAPGADGESWYEAPIVIRTHSFLIVPDSQSQVTVSCLSGEKMLSGGFLLDEDRNVRVYASYPYGQISWVVGVDNDTLFYSDATFYGKCAQPSSLTMTSATESGENTLIIASVEEFSEP